LIRKLKSYNIVIQGIGNNSYGGQCNIGRATAPCLGLESVFKMVKSARKSGKMIVRSMTWLFPQQYANLRLMHQFAEQFGLTPAARSRIIAGNDNNGSADDMDAILGGD
jgi:hypothetical protein